MLSTFSLPALSGLEKSCRAIGVRAAGECRTVLAASSAIWNLAFTFLRLCSAGLRICCRFADWMLASGCLLSVYKTKRHREETCLSIGHLLARCTRRLAAQFARRLEDIKVRSSSRSAWDARLHGGHDVLPVAGEYVEHVLVKPFKLIAHREAEILEFLRDERVCLVALL